MVTLSLLEAGEAPAVFSGVLGVDGTSNLVVEPKLNSTSSAFSSESARSTYWRSLRSSWKMAPVPWRHRSVPMYFISPTCGRASAASSLVIFSDL